MRPDSTGRSVGLSVGLSVGRSVGQSVVSKCVIVLFQGHESVAFGYECFHFSNIFMALHYKKGGTFSAFLHVEL